MIRLNPDATFILPAALGQIEEDAFAGSAMCYVTVPEDRASIPSRAFAERAHLQFIRLPGSVTSIAEDAFRDCG